MNLRWSEHAPDDLVRIAGHLFEDTPALAPDVLRRIYNSLSGLQIFPRKGRSGRKAGTRELVLSPLPYVVVYVVTEDTIVIARILHAAQRWP